jgi:hypothetical protein
MRLLLEYWARGAHNAVIHRKISAGLEEYRRVFRRIAEEALPSDQGRYGTPAGVAAAILSLLFGYSVQAIVDPEHSDVSEYMTAVEGILGRLVKAA